MKASLLLILLSFISLSYGAAVAVPTTPENSASSKGDTRSTLEKAGKAFENLGKILQTEAGSRTWEELRNTVADLKDIEEEYFIRGLFDTIGEAVKTVGGIVDGAINVARRVG